MEEEDFLVQITLAGEDLVRGQPLDLEVQQQQLLGMSAHLVGRLIQLNGEERAPTNTVQ